MAAAPLRPELIQFVCFTLRSHLKVINQEGDFKIRIFYLFLLLVEKKQKHLTTIKTLWRDFNTKGRLDLLCEQKVNQEKNSQTHEEI